MAEPILSKFLGVTGYVFLNVKRIEGHIFVFVSYLNPIKYGAQSSIFGGLSKKEPKSSKNLREKMRGRYLWRAAKQYPDQLEPSTKANSIKVKNRNGAGKVGIKQVV
jgi:hypothetical protein